MSRLGHLRDRLRDGDLNWLGHPGYGVRLTGLWLRDRIGRRRYRSLSADELRATRTSDTAFVFGSGRSLLEIEPAEWQSIARCNTISLREFPRQHWVRADYHVTSEVERLRASAELARALFDWEPRTSLDEGLAATAAWVREHLDLYRVGRYTV